MIEISKTIKAALPRGLALIATKEDDVPRPLQPRKIQMGSTTDEIRTNWTPSPNKTRGPGIRMHPRTLAPEEFLNFLFETIQRG